MDFRDTPDEARWRQEVRDFLAAEAPTPPDPDNPYAAADPRSGWIAAWREKLAPRGWIAPAWPKEYGGAGLGVMEQFILNEEFAEARVPNVGGMGVSMIGPTLIVHGNEEQKREHLSAILRGETQWCQGYSEPESGSDLASLQTRAVKDGDDYVINGSKIWTTGAHTADWMFMLARTDPDAPKHRGITYFLLDMKSPGVSVSPLTNLADMKHFNQVFFEDVRVPARNVVGEVNRGWYIGTTTLDFERSSIGSAVGQQQAIRGYINAAKRRGSDLSPVARRELADRWIEAAVARNLSYRVITMQATGQVPNYEASIAKLFNTELSQRIANTAMKVAGLGGLLAGGEQAPMRGRAGVNYLTSVSATIAGGTSEIQRNIVAQRGLGLPR